ncbi:hypothetical protein BDB01DRAFT_770524 [Pilobolus umbonatus]|nr:hypothetical protein BDB01DRAFT_770524 [Pilobolus umbonatus]
MYKYISKSINRRRIGHDINGYGRLIMEGLSNSITKENIKHTQGILPKLCMLNLRPV